MRKQLRGWVFMLNVTANAQIVFQVSIFLVIFNFSAWTLQKRLLRFL